MNNPTIDAYIERHNDILQTVVAKADIPVPLLKKAMHYSLFPGGKRLRPVLVYLAGDIAGAAIESLDNIAVAIELMHCYSLIHDDLPAMDNDDYRRGRLSVHRAFDEATAILVGDGMQGLAYKVLLSTLPSTLAPEVVMQITLELIQASGFAGMVSGQSLDLTDLVGVDVTEERLRYIHHLKTGTLFTSCIKMALLAGNPSEAITTSLCQFAHLLGIVFQMQDDYNDRYADQKSLGKNRASDVANQKTTYAGIMSQQDLLDFIEAYYAKARQALHPVGAVAEVLLELTHLLYERTHME